jgi:transcriptional regulator with XRE-family HTH domain
MAMGWSRAALAKLSGLSVTQVRAAEQGRLKDPDALAALDEILTRAGGPLPTRQMLLDFGRNLRDARLLAGTGRLGLTRKGLVRLSGLSESTIKFVETGRIWPSRYVCLRLYAVEILKLHWEDLEPFAGPPPRAAR